MKNAKKQGLAPLERCVSRPLALGMSAVCVLLTAAAAAFAYPLAVESDALIWLVLGAALALGFSETAIFLLLRYVAKKYLHPVSAVSEAITAHGDFARTASGISPTSAETEALLCAVQEMDERSTGCLLELERALRGMASGDFTAWTECGQGMERDGVYDALEDANQKLKGAIGSIRTSLEQLTGPMEHLEQNVSDLTQHSQEQQALAGLLLALERLTAQLQQRADSAASVSSAADTLRQKLIRCDQQNRELAQAVERINDCAIAAGKIVKDMETASFQCSVLARTAYVEAAGAGINGKGFAIVASELRVLASRSAQAAQEAAVFMDEMRQTVRESSSLAAAAVREMQTVSSSGTEVCRKAAGAAQNAVLTKDLQEAVQQANRLDAMKDDAQAHAARTARTAQVLKARFSKLREALQVFRLHSD